MILKIGNWTILKLLWRTSMLFKFRIYYDYTNNSIEELEANDVEEAYQLMYEEYPEAEIICIDCDEKV